jgi:hypothetical protein
MPAALSAGMLASLPFLIPVHRLPLPSFEAEWLALLLGTVLAMSLGLRRNAVLPVIALSPCLLAVVLLVQYGLDMFAFGASAALAIGYLLWAAALSFAGRSMAGPDLTRVLAWGLLLGGVVNALAGVLQAGGIWAAFAPWIAAPIAGEGAYGNLAQQNHFAAHMALALAACFHLQRASENGKRFAVPAALLLVALVSSGSRSGLLMLLVVAAFYYRGRTWPVLGAALGLGALALLAHQGQLGQTLARLTQWGDPWGPRVAAWVQAGRMFADAPLLGTGFDHFAAQLVEQLRDGEKHWGVDQYAHNLILQLAATCGLAGLLGVLAPLACFLVTSAKQEQHRLAWCVLAVIALHSMLEQPLHYAYFLGLFALCAGTVAQAETGIRLGSAARIGVVGVGVLALAQLVQTVREYDDLASTVYQDGSAPRYRDSTFLAPLRQLALPQASMPAERPVNERLAFNARVMHFAPVPETMYRHVALLLEAGQLPAACSQWRKASRAYPAEQDFYRTRLQGMAGYEGLAACLLKP